MSASSTTTYSVTLHPTNGALVGCGLSLVQCPECAALVVEDFMADHLYWHDHSDYDGPDHPARS